MQHISVHLITLPRHLIFQITSHTKPLLYPHYLDACLLTAINSIHRYSMPSTAVNSHLRPAMSTFNHSSGLDSFNAAKYLFPSEEDQATVKGEDRMPTPDIRSYLQMTEPDDKFPTLSRRDGSGLVSDSVSPHPDFNSLLSACLALCQLRRLGSGKFAHPRPRVLHPQPVSFLAPEHAPEFFEYVPS